MQQGFLPDFLWPVRCDALIRVGKDHDGGYLLDKRNLAEADNLLSFGVNDDWSFEAAVLGTRPMPVTAYDGSVGSGVLLKRAIKSLAQPHPVRAFASSFAAYLDYGRFFSENRTHIRKFVGPRDAEGVVSLDSAIRNAAGGSRRLLIKMDIEGAEYRLLDDLVRHADEVAGLVLEFHDVDLHIARIRAFIAAFPLALVHTHVNNYGSVGLDGIPTVVECSFTSAPVDRTTFVAGLPHALDMPNHPGLEDFRVTRAGLVEAELIS